MKKILLAAVAWIMPVIAFAVTLWAGSGNTAIIRDDLDDLAEKEERMLSPEERLQLRARQQRYK